MALYAKNFPIKVLVVKVQRVEKRGYLFTFGRLPLSFAPYQSIGYHPLY